MQIDIKFIAKRAGVSPATVSRVMNRTKAVSPELRERVMAAVNAYNYRPNNMARGLILKKSCLIGVMTPNVSNSFHATMIAAIEEEANRCGYNVIVANVHDDFARQKQSFQSLCERQVDGIILLHENTSEQLEELRRASRVPIVLAGIHIIGDPLPSVCIDDRQAAFEAVTHLINLGHKKIGGIFNDCYSLGVLRRQGYEAALKEADIAVDDGKITFTQCTISGGAQSAERLFEVNNPPTALFCVSDEIAIGAMDWLIESGKRIPEDVSVVGFDDILLSQIFRPRLTTVHQPIAQIGKAATALLLELLDEKTPENSRIILPYDLISRGSCKECK